MADIPDNRLDDLHADHLAEEVREIADRNRRIADLETQLQEALAEVARWRTTVGVQAGRLGDAEHDRDRWKGENVATLLNMAQVVGERDTAKAEAAPLRAALSNIDDCSHDTLGEMGDCPDYKTAFRALEKGCGALQFIGGRARAALSDAGRTGSKG